MYTTDTKTETGNDVRSCKWKLVNEANKEKSE